MSFNSDDIIDNYTRPKNVIAIRDFQFPMQFEFKIGTLANDFIGKDASGQPVVYVYQKMFKFKEAIQVFNNDRKEQLIYTIDADRIIDFNASYHFTNQNNQQIGRIGRRGMRSIWKSTYEIYDEQNKLEFNISEENPWAKFWDGLLSEVPLLSLFSGYFFNPRYVLKREGSEDVVIRMSKEKSFFGRRFKIEKITNLQDGEDERVVLGLMMMSLLERRRG